MNPAALRAGLRIVAVDPDIVIRRDVYGTVVAVTPPAGDRDPAGAVVDLDEIGPVWLAAADLDLLDPVRIRLELPEGLTGELPPGDTARPGIASRAPSLTGDTGSALVDLWRAEARRAGLEPASFALLGDPPGRGRRDGSGSVALAECTAAGEQYLVVLSPASAVAPAMIGARRCTRHELW